MLQVWLPLNKEGDFQNKGLADVSVINNGTTYDANGKIGGCYKFNGNSNYITINIGNIINNKSWSLCVWSYTNSGKTYYPVFSIGTSTSGFTLHGSKNRLEGGDGTNRYDRSLTTGNTHGVWEHIVVIYDKTKFIVYRNGQQKVSLDWANGIGSQNVIKLGNFWGGSLYDGLMNDFRLYDHCLSPKEVKELSKGLVLHYPLNDSAISKNLASRTDWEKTSSNEYMQIINTFSDQGLGEYTFSCEMKVATGNPSVNIYCSDGIYTRKYNYSVSNISVNGVTNGKLSQEWQKIVCKLTFTTSTADSTVMPHISTYYTYGSGQIVSVRYPKLEKGWNPNPIYTNSNYNTVYDCSGYQNNGTITGTLTSSTDSPRYDKCTVFPTAGYISSSSLKFGDLPFTVSCWVKVTSGNHAIAGTKNYSWKMSVFNNKLHFIGWTGEADRFNGSSSNNIDYNKWNHCIFVYDGVNIKLYLNGIETVLSKLRSGNFTIRTEPIQIAGNIYAHGQGSSLTGNISDFRIYATALSAEDIKELYESAGSIDNGQNLLSCEFVEENNSKINKTGIINSGQFIESNNMQIYENKIETNQLIEI